MDQIAAKAFERYTQLSSLQLTVDDNSMVGSCDTGYSCAYSSTLSWLTPTLPLMTENNPRVVFERLFGSSDSTDAKVRELRLRQDRSILDSIREQTVALQRGLPATDRQRVDGYLDDIREIERRIQQVEARNVSGETRELPDAPIGVPDSFSEHVKIMMDLQVLAFASDVTRVFSFKLGRDGSSRSYPESGVTTGFHPASHHGEREERIMDYAKINRYHVSLVPYLLEKLKATPDGDGTLLDNSLVIYGSPMGDSNVHNHKRCPLFLAGRMGGRLKGGRHVKAADGTPMANAMLTLLHHLGRTDITTFGDSTSELDLNGAAGAATL
jgi:hypothetical protein